jgi:hypothetical protein
MPIFRKKITVNYTTSQLTKGTSQLEKVRHELEVAGKTLCLSFCRENSQILILFPLRIT